MNTESLTIGSYSYYYAINHGSNNNIDPIIFINGAFQSMKSWRNVAKYFAGSVTTIVADLPGWGDADLLPARYGFDFLGEAILKILEKEKISKVNVVSTSYGTPVAINFAKSNTEMVSSIVLSSTLLEIGNHMSSAFDVMESIIERNDRSDLIEFLLNIGLLNTQIGELGLIKNYRYIRELFRRQITRMSSLQLNKFLENTRRIIMEGRSSVDDIKDIRMLSCTGKYDAFTPTGDCLEVSSTFSNGTFVSIDEADHLFLLQQSETACQLIQAFLLDQELDKIRGCELLAESKMIVK